MTGTKSAPFLRGDLWMVDFGQPIGTELGMEHPALIISAQELNDATVLRRVIVVPGTITRFENKQGAVLSFHLEVCASSKNGLKHTTYFMSEQVRAASTVRFRKRLGALESNLLKGMEDRLCLVMKLFR